MAETVDLSGKNHPVRIVCFVAGDTGTVFSTVKVVKNDMFLHVHVRDVMKKKKEK